MPDIDLIQSMWELTLEKFMVERMEVGITHFMDVLMNWPLLTMAHHSQGPYLWRLNYIKKMQTLLCCTTLMKPVTSFIILQNTELSREVYTPLPPCQVIQMFGLPIHIFLVM